MQDGKYVRERQSLMALTSKLTRTGHHNPFANFKGDWKWPTKRTTC